MEEQIRIYHGDTVKILPVDRMREFSFGEHPQCSVRLPTGTGSSMRFFYQNGAWQASCTGQVQCAGKLVQREQVRPGDMFVLSTAKQLALQLVRKESSPILQIPLNQAGSLLIGRNADCTLRLNDPWVSKGHARIDQTGGMWCLVDLSSNNGVFVNGKRIHDCVLREKDTILIGKFELIFYKGTLTVYGEAGSASCSIQKQQKRPQRPPYPYFNRSPRLRQERPAGKVEIEAAPGIGGKPEIDWVAILLPSFGMMAASVLVALFTFMSPIGLMMSVPMMLISVFMAVRNHKKQTKKFTQMEENRRNKYGQYIRSIEEKLGEMAEQQRNAVLCSNPSPDQCLEMACSADPRLWGRTASDLDFLSLRVGLGEEPFCVEIQAPKVGFLLEEDTFTRVPQQVVEKYRSVADVPVLCDLLRRQSLGIVGNRRDASLMAQNLITQLTTNHGYDEIKLVVLFPKQEMNIWEWMRWLPHTWNETRSMRYMACDSYDAAQMLASVEETLKRQAGSGGSSPWQSSAPPVPYYVFLVADPGLLQNQPVGDYLLRNDPALGVSCILLSHDVTALPYNVSQILEVNGGNGELYIREHAGERRKFLLDRPINWESFARKLAPIRLPEKGPSQLLPASISFLEGYHVKQPDALDLGEFWDNSCNYKSMAVPIGVRANGENFYFDIHEKKHGPHGLVAGTTGSGKTEMVQSWILSMALQFSPQDVSFVLIDFKGTGLIQPFLDLPHLAGTISDLDTNISRNLIALKSEMARREALFAGAGVKNIAEYLAEYQKHAVGEPLPYLFVVIDEYAEFKTQFPDFTKEIESLFSRGRSLGVYIILMTQSPSGVVSGKSEDNVKFRWCLKVVSIAASKEVLGGHDDAAWIKNPGRAYVRVGTDEIFEPIQSFYSGAPYHPGEKEHHSVGAAVSCVALNGGRTVSKAPSKGKIRAKGAEIDAVVSHIRAYTEHRHIPDARHIWQERMPSKIYLPKLLEHSTDQESRSLAPVIGLVDDPASQSQRSLRLPLSKNGHAVVFGSPGSGKTVLLHTLAASLCMSYTPEEVNLYIMDFGSWSMGMFKDFPHVGGVANSNEEEKIIGLAQMLEGELQERKQRFSELGVGNLQDYRRATGKAIPYLVLLVDKFDFNSICQLYPQLEDFFLKLGQGGSNYGVLMVATCFNVMSLGYKLNQSIKTSLALQMTDAADYGAIVGKTGGLLPENFHGRGLVKEEDHVLEFQTALPAEKEENGTYASVIRALAKESAARWGGKKAGGVSVMPDVVDLSSVQAQGDGFVLGLTVDGIKPVETKLDDPHFLLISGLPQSGKTTLLRALAQQMLEREGVRVVLFGNGAEYAACQSGLEILESGEEADRFLESLAAELSARQAAKKTQADQKFSPIYFLVDGYRHFFDEISQQSVSRLRALLQIGAGLGVAMAAADNAQSLSTLIEFKEPLTMLLAKGPAILLGGNALQHLAIGTELGPVEKSKPLKQWEGWYKTENGICVFKSINSK